MSFGNIQNPIAKISAAAVFVGVGILTVTGFVPETSITLATALTSAAAGFLFATNVVGQKNVGA